MSRSKGAKTFWSGSQYEGDMMNGKRHGHGVKTWPNGDRYEGEWRFDKKDGSGRMSEAEAVYDGEWQAGLKHGKGTLKFAKGESYEGEWQNDQAHGKGRFVKKNGNVYEGEYRCDKCHGYGTYTFMNGDTYEGEWKAGLKSGQGTISWSSGKKFAGRFSDDCPILGELTERDGKVYRVTYDGNRKFSRGAEPETQELIRTASGDKVGREWDDGVGDGVLAPSLQAAAAKMRAASTADFSPPVVKSRDAAASFGGQESEKVDDVRAVPPDPPHTEKKDEWDPFAEISASVASASVPAVPPPPQDWDPFGEKPAHGQPLARDPFDTHPLDTPPPQQAATVGASPGRPQFIESAIELSSPVLPATYRGGLRPSPPGSQPYHGKWDSIMQKAEAWGNRSGAAGKPARAAGPVPAPASFLASETWAPVELVCPLTLQVMVDPVVAPDGVPFEREALAKWQQMHGVHASPSAPQAPSASARAAADLPTHSALRDKIERWHRSRTWALDSSRLTVLEQDVLGKGAWGVVKQGRLHRSGRGDDVTVAVKMWPTAEAALAQRLCEREAAVYKVAAGSTPRLCVLHGTAVVNGRGVLVLQHCPTSLIGAAMRAWQWQWDG